MSSEKKNNKEREGKMAYASFRDLIVYRRPRDCEEADDPKKSGIIEEMSKRVKFAQKLLDKKLESAREKVLALRENPDWERKIVRYLGKLPDAEIVAILGVDKNVICRLRVKKHIKPYEEGDLLGKIVESIGGLRPPPEKK